MGTVNMLPPGGDLRPPSPSRGQHQQPGKAGSAVGVLPPEGDLRPPSPSRGQHQQPGKAGSAVFLEWSRLRRDALVQLWLHRDGWRLPLPRALMRRERSTQLAELMPAVMVISLMVGALIFITLPPALGDSYMSALATLWPAWVVQAAPLAAAQVLAMQRAPTLALELSHRHGSGEFAALGLLQATPAAYPCIPLLAAHAAVTAAASFLLVGLTLVFGFAGAFVLAVGDLRQSLDAVFVLISPLDWLRSGIAAALYGLACSLATMLFAWPGTQVSAAAVDAHRLGLRAMIVSSLAIIGTAVAFNWLMNLLGFLKWW